MTLTFPNLSRSYDTTRECVRFSGYDHTREVSFFVEEGALRQVDGGALATQDSLLSAFDRNRDRICRAATKAYDKRHAGSYTLKTADI